MNVQDKIVELKKLQAREDLPELLMKCGLAGEYCELGVWEGEGIHLLNRANPERIHGVDVFQDLPVAKDLISYGDDRRKKLKENMIGINNFILYDMTNQKAVKYFELGQFDLVYIDADHKFNSVVLDIEQYWPLVKSGGIMGGHDYKHKGQCGVIQAVDFFIEENGLEDNFNVTSEPVKGWINPSWFVVKP